MIVCRCPGYFGRGIPEVTKVQCLCVPDRVFWGGAAFINYKLGGSDIADKCPSRYRYLGTCIHTYIHYVGSPAAYNAHTQPEETRYPRSEAEARLEPVSVCLSIAYNDGNDGILSL